MILSLAHAPQSQQCVATDTAAGHLDLVLHLPALPYPVLFHLPPTGAPPTDARPVDVSSLLGSMATPHVPPTPRADSALIVLHDSEMGRDNPSELKAQKLARSLTRGMVDHNLKPDTEERRAINAILLSPPNRQLSTDAMALLWRFRYTLVTDKRALTKFLKCVDWSDAHEALQATELMAQWAPIDFADALELLSPDYTNEAVRRHAVGVLSKADDEELRYYLLQLVQVYCWLWWRRLLWWWYCSNTFVMVQ